MTNTPFGLSGEVNGTRSRLARTSGAVPDSARHGMVGTYTNYKCRCEPCIAAHSEACRQSKQRRVAELRVGLEHGTISTYNNYDCRCAACRAAMADYYRERRRRKKEQQ